MAKPFELRALITGVDKLSPMLSNAQKRVAVMQKTVGGLGIKGMSLGDALAGGAIVAPFAIGVKKAIEFESAMADVKKVVDFDTPDGFAKMGNDIKEMSTRLPMAAKDIAAIVAAGGQSGIAQSDLGKFAEDAVKMGIAFDSTAEEAGDMMAKWRTSFKMGQEEVVALADKINHLSNTGAANAQQISSIVTRIGPLGAVAGLASGEIAAMGATLAGVGVQEEVAATGMKNFMLALTAGEAATKTQQSIFAALRMDSAQIAADMQKDAKGTIVKVLESISKVDASKQASVLQQLFGKESIGAIAPMLTNLDLLKNNLAQVGDKTQYAGSMQKEYDARSQTTANQIQLMKNNMENFSMSLGAALLPAINDAIRAMIPFIHSMAVFAQANPEVVKGVLGAVAGFFALKVAVSGVMSAMSMFKAFRSTPLGIGLTLLAMLAGVIIANWSSISAFFKGVWESITGAFSTAWEFIKTVFSVSPLGLIINNWGAISTYLSGLWASITGALSATWEWIKSLFSWSPVESIMTSWSGMPALVNAIFGVVNAITNAFFNGLKTIFAWTPLGIVMANWQPIVTFFKGIFDQIQGYIQPIMNGAKAVAGLLGFGGGAAAPRAGAGAQKPSVAAASGKAAQQQVNGNIKVSFANPPPGMQVASATPNGQPVKLSTNVGKRSMAVG